MPVRSEGVECGLCGRLVQHTSRHHLVPRSQGGEITIQLCVPCHKTVHAFFENKTLAGQLHTPDSLREAPELAAYLKWIRRQPDRHIRVYRSRRFRR